MISTTKVNYAKKYAIAAHGDQKYGEEFPYAIHLQAVESVLIRFGMFNETLLCAAWLHDVLEDTDKTYEEMSSYFGIAVADIVAKLTEPKGGNREWRHAQTYPRIAQDVNAVIVKLADRIANIEAGGDKAGMYLKEYFGFKLALVSHSLPMVGTDVMQMWNYLDELMIELQIKLANQPRSPRIKAG